MTTDNKSRRQRQLAAIHAAKRDLGMDDLTYRRMLLTVADTTSAKTLNKTELARVLKHLRKVGWQRTKRKRVAQHPGTPHNLDNERRLQKIEALLSDMKLPWSYADAIAKQQTGIARVAWLHRGDHLMAVIAALMVEQEKRWLLSFVTCIQDKLGLSDAEMKLAYPHTLRKNWQRHRPSLRQLVDWLRYEWKHQRQEKN